MFGNLYSAESDLPSASTYHGMFAHVHGTGKGYFAHAGNWHKLLDETSSTTSNLSEGTNLYYTDERVDDRVNGLLTAGSNVTLTYDDANNTLTIASTAGAGTITLANLSATNASASGGGSLAYNNSNGVFTFTPPDLSSYASLTNFSVSTASAGTSALSYNNANGVFTYTPPDLSSYVTAASSTTFTNKGGNISQWSNDSGYLTGITGQSLYSLSNVFTSSAPSDGQVLTWDNANSYWKPAAAAGGIALTDLSATNASASGGGSLAYNNSSGAFTFTPPDLSSYLTGITGQALANLSNVNNATPTDGQVLTWDNANSYWKPATAASGGSDTFIRYSEYTAASTASPNTITSITGGTSSSRYGWSGQGATLDSPLGSNFTVTVQGGTSGGMSSSSSVGWSSYRVDITNNTGSSISLNSGSTSFVSNFTLANGSSGSSYVDSNLSPLQSGTQLFAVSGSYNSSSNGTKTQSGNFSNSLTWTNGSTISFGFRTFSFGTHLNAELTWNYLEIMFAGGTYSSGSTTASQGLRVNFAYATTAATFGTLYTTPQSSSNVRGIYSGSSASSTATDYDWQPYLDYTNGLVENQAALKSVVAGNPLTLDRTGSDGTIVEFRDDDVEAGEITVGGNGLAIIAEGKTGLRFQTHQISPMKSGSDNDNGVDCGHPAYRFDDVYATNGTIQTSDQNEKNTIADSDLGLDFINRLSPKSYIFNDKTRTHYGLIAQDVETVLSDISKPTSAFAGFIKTDISAEQDGSQYRYGLRYNEFVGVLIKALQEADDKIDALEARIAALEA